jgi:pimeloyl-ACP methyl ester carboxylesterase
VLSAVVGVAAAGVAAGVAAERILLRRRHAPIDDPYASEPFDQLPYDEARVVRTPDGLDIYVEVVEAQTPGTEPSVQRPRRLSRALARLGVSRDNGEQRPTLVFVHGFCLDMGTYHFQRKGLAGYRRVLFDQPGHGRSSRLRSGEYSIDALGHALRAVLDATCPVEPVVLIGHSMGGMSIMALAEQAPELFGERIVGVTLISSSAGGVEEITFGLPDVLARFRGSLLPIVSSASRLTAGAIDRARQASTDLAWLLTRRYGFGSPKPSPTVVSYVENMNARTPTEVVARYLRTLHGHARLAALQALRHVPVLIMVGDRDALTPRAHSEEMARELPDATLVVVPNSGHVPMLEHSDVVNEALTEFLEKIDS